MKQFFSRNAFFISAGVFLLIAALFSMVVYSIFFQWGARSESGYHPQASPVYNADKIKAPLFIAQGANDPRVKKSESDQMVEAMRERGVEVEYLVKDNEGHGFRNEENRFEFYEAMEKFLVKHIGGAFVEGEEAEAEGEKSEE